MGVMKVERSESGASWFVVDVLEDGRRIVHGRKDDLDSADDYLHSLSGRRLTVQERAELGRADKRTRFRQHNKRLPTDQELNEVVAGKRDVRGRLTRESEEASAPVGEETETDARRA